MVAFDSNSGPSCCYHPRTGVPCLRPGPRGTKEMMQPLSTLPECHLFGFTQIPDMPQTEAIVRHSFDLKIPYNFTHKVR